MGLYIIYTQIRNQILFTKHLPTINHAYAIIISTKSHKAVETYAGILEVIPIISDWN